GLERGCGGAIGIQAARGAERKGDGRGRRLVVPVLCRRRGHAWHQRRVRGDRRAGATAVPGSVPAEQRHSPRRARSIRYGRSGGDGCLAVGGDGGSVGVGIGIGGGLDPLQEEATASRPETLR
ncbi:hypothetical protein HK405_001858, partial [Cladochytrium tenue]